MATAVRLGARDRIMRAAAALFYENGIAATGIDTITARAGVAKQSLYNNFASKADLVDAYLRARHDEWLDLYEKRVAVARTPLARVIAVFEAYEDHAGFAYERGFRGCGLLNAAAEFAAGEAGRLAVRDHKAEVEGIIAQHLTEIIPDDTALVARTARHLSFLLEGSMTRAGLDGTDRCVTQAKAMAADMVAAL